MSVAKKHHYVPQAYLRFFAIKVNSQYKLHVFDKSSCKQYIANIIDVAQKNNYNKVENSRFCAKPPMNDPLYYESKYSRIIEEKMPRIINNIVSTCLLTNNNSTVLTPKIKYELAKLIVVQLLRTPSARQSTFDLGLPVCEKIISETRKHIRKITSTQKKEEYNDVLDSFEYSKDVSNSFHLLITTDEERINSFSKVLIKNRAWVIYENKQCKVNPFVTSDTPVTMYDFQTGKCGISGNGLDKITTIISMPLTPKYLVALYHKNTVWGKISESYEDICIQIDEDRFITNQNLLQFKQSYRQIYTNGAINYYGGEM
ncbi:MAG: hypothetical protein BWY15_01732 [Firmicutes bacterium ADurb.Bin193]|nr:MAG: hypothetical protein BWY15_01732 [Firmicutes bacterium ADurb.Bin193]